MSVENRQPSFSPKDIPQQFTELHYHVEGREGNIEKTIIVPFTSEELTYLERAYQASEQEAFREAVFDGRNTERGYYMNNKAPWRMDLLNRKKAFEQIKRSVSYIDLRLQIPGIAENTQQVFHTIREALTPFLPQVRSRRSTTPKN